MTTGASGSGSSGPVPSPEPHLDGYLRAPDAVEVTAVADIDPDACSASSPIAPAAPGTSLDYREMLTSSLVDAVDICLPHHLHADAIVAAAEAGKHVLCEKPLCLTVDEARRMQASGHDSRDHPDVLPQPAVHATGRWPLAELLQEGILGTVYEARTTDCLLQRPRSDDDGLAGAPRHERAAASSSIPGYHPTYLLLHLIDSRAGRGGRIAEPAPADLHGRRGFRRGRGSLRGRLRSAP